VPLSKVTNFFVKKNVAQDPYLVEKEIFRRIGQVKKMEWKLFQQLLCVGIFREALMEMINDIEELNEKYEHLPLILKLGAYRRSFLMKGISKGGK